MNDYSFNSVEIIPDLKASAAFTVNSSEVFKEQVDMLPHTIDEGFQYMPWGADNEMPYKILELIESDETLSTCQIFNAEVCYGSGLVYDSAEAKAKVQQEVKDFLMDNDLASYFLGVCQDFKHFGFAVSVIILNGDGSKIVRILRKEACYCRFAPAETDGRIPYLLYANWRKSIASKDEVEKIEILDGHSHGLTYRSAWQQSEARSHGLQHASSPSSHGCRPRTAPIIPSLTTARYSRATGITSRSSSAWLRRPS